MKAKSKITEKESAIITIEGELDSALQSLQPMQDLTFLSTDSDFQAEGNAISANVF